MIRVRKIRASATPGIKSLRHPLTAVFRQVQAPDELLRIQIEREYRIEAGGSQKQQVVASANLMAVPQILVAIRADEFKRGRLTK